MSTKVREGVHLALRLQHDGGGAAQLWFLLAPKSGAETRRDVARYAKRAQVQATRFSRSVKSGVSTMVERSKALVKRDDHKEAA